MAFSLPSGAERTGVGANIIRSRNAGRQSRFLRTLAELHARAPFPSVVGERAASNQSRKVVRRVACDTCRSGQRQQWVGSGDVLKIAEDFIEQRGSIDQRAEAAQLISARRPAGYEFWRSHAPVSALSATSLVRSVNRHPLR